MTNKPMLSVKKFIHEITHEGGEMVEVDELPEFCGSELYVLDSDYQSLHEQLELLRALLDKPAAQHQGEPVAWVECSPAWLKAGGDCATAPRICVGREGISHLHPAHSSAEQPAPVAVPHTMRSVMEAYEAAQKNHLTGTSNFCAAMAARLNGVKP